MISVPGQHDMKVRVYLRRSSIWQQIPDYERKLISWIMVVNTIKPARIARVHSENMLPLRGDFCLAQLNALLLP